jgi:exopolysaccharide biosynthesis polyprenyl glycosylphosphotransferase
MDHCPPLPALELASHPQRNSVSWHQSSAGATAGGCRRLSLPGCVAILATAEFGAAVASAGGIFLLPQSKGVGSSLAQAHAHSWAIVACVVFGWTVAALSQSLYSEKILLAQARVNYFRSAIAALFAVALGLLAAYALDLLGPVVRADVMFLAVALPVMVLAVRAGWSFYLVRLDGRSACLNRALVLAGSIEAAQEVGEIVRRESEGKLGVFATAAIPGSANAPPMSWVEDAVKNGLIDRVIVADYDRALPQVQILLERLALVAVDVTIIPSLAGLPGAVRHVDRIGRLPAIDYASRPLTPAKAALKRAEDIVIAGTILLLQLPLLAVVSLAIKIESRGPIFFCQMREGYHGQVFKLWKFRTMRADMCDYDASIQTSRNDQRVTRVGRILRRLSLDELPQLFNVLRGEMAIVGPRPHALGMTSVGLPMTQVLETYSARHRLKPGITGWAQISGCRGQIDSHDKLRRRVALDCEYIDRWSLGLDLWILARTASLVLFDSDAY